MNIQEQLNQGQKDYGASSKTNFFKFEKGDNRLRILTEGEVLATHFFGKGVKASTCYGIAEGCPFHGEGAPKDAKGMEKKASIKYTCYVVNVNDKDETIQLADLPYSVTKQIGEYQTNIDYAFDSFPMPYDVTIKFDPDSPSPAGMYKVIASPKRSAVSENITAKLAVAMSKTTPEQSVSKKKEWQLVEHKKSGIWISPEKIAGKEEQRRENYKADVEKFNAENRKPEKEYPADEINPDDIPF